MKSCLGGMALIRSPEFHIDATIVCSREANVRSWRLYSRSQRKMRDTGGDEIQILLLLVCKSGT